MSVSYYNPAVYYFSIPMNERQWVYDTSLFEETSISCSWNRVEHLKHGTRALTLAPIVILIRVVMSLWNTLVAIVFSVARLLTGGSIDEINQQTIKAWKDAGCEAYAALITSLTFPIFVAGHFTGVMIHPSIGGVGPVLHSLVSYPLYWR